jgi:hypothetical protein
LIQKRNGVGQEDQRFPVVISQQCQDGHSGFWPKGMRLHEVGP